MEHRYKQTIWLNASGLLRFLPDKPVLNSVPGNHVRRYFGTRNISTNTEPTVRHSQIVYLVRKAISKFGSFSNEMLMPYVMDIPMAPVML